MNREFYHKFMGRKYLVDVFQPFEGICDPPDVLPDRAIRLPNGLDGSRKSLIILIHEAIHACDWNKSEADVKRTAEDIGKLLWKLGYRRNSK